MTEKEFDEILEEVTKENKALKNRCFTLSSGTMCFFCTLECEHRTCNFHNKESEDE